MVVWCCAMANTKPRFQPSDDAEYCLYVKLSASAGLATKTSTAHKNRESFATLLPPSRAFLRPAYKSNAITAAFPEREEMRTVRRVPGMLAIDHVRGDGQQALGVARATIGRILADHRGLWRI